MQITCLLILIGMPLLKLGIQIANDTTKDKKAYNATISFIVCVGTYFVLYKAGVIDLLLNATR